MIFMVIAEMFFPSCALAINLPIEKYEIEPDTHRSLINSDPSAYYQTNSVSA